MRSMLLLMVLLSVVGCGARGMQRGYGGGDLVPVPELAATTVDRRTVSRTNLQGSSDSFRLVEVYRRNQEFGNAVPEYRIFDVDTGSTLDLLGLKNGDLLRAANGYAVYNIAGFREFARLLSREEGVTFDIVRAGHPLRVEVRIE